MSKAEYTTGRVVWGNDDYELDWDERAEDAVRAGHEVKHVNFSEVVVMTRKEFIRLFGEIL